MLARSQAVVDRSIVVKRCLLLFLVLLGGQPHLSVRFLKVAIGQNLHRRILRSVALP